MERIYFLNKNDRDDFFNKVKQLKKSWMELAKFLGTNRSMMESYRKGKLSIPLNRFSLLMNSIEDKDKNYFNQKISKRKSNWGQIIGGKNAYKINKERFDYGRKKAAKISKDKVKYDFNTNLPLSEDLCEFIGAIIGDGFTNKYGYMFQTQITGDKILDEEYYYKKLKPICEKLFNISPKISEGPGCIRLNIYSKRLFEMLTKRFDIPAGKKCYSITIPNEILKSDDKLISATLRGMFDTDGGIGLDKREIYKKPYIRINYTSASPILIEQIHKILENYKIPHSVHSKNDAPAKQIQINGEKNVKLFLKRVGFSNPRHLKKVRHLL
ncbi:MAG: LAGLIDADG family homing endonuclease [Nanoarchaeota archaeon]